MTEIAHTIKGTNTPLPTSKRPAEKMSVNSSPYTSIKTKLFLVFVFPIISILILSFNQFSNIDESFERDKRVSHTHHVIATMRKLEKLKIDMETGQRGYIITGKENFLEPYRNAKKEWQNNFHTLKNLVSDNNSQQKILHGISLLHQRWENEAATPEITARKQGDMIKAANLIEKESGKNLMDEARALINEFILAEETLLEQRAELAQNGTKKIKQRTLIGSAFIILMCIFLSLALARNIVNRLFRLLEATKNLKTDEFIPIQDNNKDELSMLANSFNEMAQVLNQASKKLIQANKSKDIFLANMSHEIRTPMNGILGMAELIEGDNLTKDQKKYLTTLLLSGRTLLTIINDILNFSKIQNGQVEFESIPFCLENVIDSLVTAYDIQGDRNVNLTTIFDKKLPTYIIGDPTRLQQILGNLLSNAFKFTKKGTVTLEIKEISRTLGETLLQFRVTDTGIGMSKETQRRIFNDFEQGNLSITREYGGTGLGLSICKKLLSQVRGEIWAESEEGEGSTFVVRMSFGVADADAGTDAGTDADAGAGNFSQLKILLVEDNPVNIIVAEGMLKHFGAQYVTASNGREAVSLACKQENGFDCILMDCEMPVMDGYEATKHIRNWENTNNLPKTWICALTANVLKEQMQLCKEAGMDDHLTKPVNLISLENILSAVK